MTRVVAPSRLHFGLLHVPGDPAGSGGRRYGGVGLMIDRPGVSLRVEAADDWAASGPSAERALEFARRVVAGNGTTDRQQPVRVTVESCPPEHVGLGVGTQLGLAVADAVRHEFRQAPLTAENLARLAGRGERSRIGVQGYRQGGLIVDGGRGPMTAEGGSTILARERFPHRWRVVLARPTGAARWHGEAERRAFARPRDPGAAVQATEVLCRHVLLGILPAVHEHDFRTFSEAVYEYNRTAGEAFAADQGGTYAGPTIAGLITTLRGWGVAGVGQSSWGPTVFAFAESDDEARHLADRLTRDVTGLESVIVTPASAGASLTRDGVPLDQHPDQTDQEHVRGQNE